MTAKLGFVDDFALRIFLLRNENFTSGNFPCIDDYSIYPNKLFSLVHGIDAAESNNILLNVYYDFLVREARQSNLTIPLLIIYKP